MTNEGKCCDAVLRILEARFGEKRHSLSCDTRENASVEVECYIGDKKLALEHTFIEPYEGKTSEDLVITEVLDPVTVSIKDEKLVPPIGRYWLMIKGGAGTDLRSSKFNITRSAILKWARHAITQVQPGAKSVVVLSPSLEVPFEVAIRRIMDRGQGVFETVRNVPDHLENERNSRITRALGKKLPKLEVCRRNGAYSVLIFENTDIAITNHILIADAVGKGLREGLFSPDEIFVVDTFITSRWVVWDIRRGNLGLTELSEWGKISTECDPADLIDITGWR